MDDRPPASKPIQQPFTVLPPTLPATLPKPLALWKNLTVPFFIPLGEPPVHGLLPWYIRWFTSLSSFIGSPAATSPGEGFAFLIREPLCGSKYKSLSSHCRPVSASSRRPPQQYTLPTEDEVALVATPSLVRKVTAP